MGRALGENIIEDYNSCVQGERQSHMERFLILSESFRIKKLFCSQNAPDRGGGRMAIL